MVDKTFAHYQLTVTNTFVRAAPKSSAVYFVRKESGIGAHLIHGRALSRLNWGGSPSHVILGV